MRPLTLVTDQWQPPPRPLSTVELVSANDRRARLIAAGEFDLANADELRLPLLRQLAAGRKAVALDTSAVTFLDVIAAETLWSTQQQFQAAGARLLISNPSRPVSRLLHLIGLERQMLTTQARFSFAAGD